MDESSGVPVYLQLRDQLLHALARGELRRGEQLPTVRELAVELAINPNTVNRAYGELERDGILETQRGRGTFLSEGASADRRPHQAKLQELAERFVAQALSLGFEQTAIVRAVQTHIRKQR